MELIVQIILFFGSFILIFAGVVGFKLKRVYQDTGDAERSARLGITPILCLVGGIVWNICFLISMYLF